MTNHEQFPVQSEFRDDLLTKLNELAQKGGQAALEGVEVSVELIEGDNNG